MPQFILPPTILPHSSQRPFNIRSCFESSAFVYIHFNIICTSLCSFQHWDYFFDKVNSVNGGNRFATVLMYLAAADEGGETVFPKVWAYLRHLPRTSSSLTYAAPGTQWFQSHPRPFSSIPPAPHPHSPTQLPAPNGSNPTFSECARHNLAVKPKKGDAILFHRSVAL